MQFLNVKIFYNEFSGGITFCSIIHTFKKNCFILIFSPALEYNSNEKYLKAFLQKKINIMS